MLNIGMRNAARSSTSRPVPPLLVEVIGVACYDMSYDQLTVGLHWCLAKKMGALAFAVIIFATQVRQRRPGPVRIDHHWFLARDKILVLRPKEIKASTVIRQNLRFLIGNNTIAIARS